MADLELSVVAEELGKSLKDLAPQVEAELQAAVQNLAQAAYSAMVAKVQSMSLDPKNRQAYLKALKFQDLGDATWLIYLDGEWPNKLEEGLDSYSIKDVLLASQKVVEVGSRSGQPWVQRNKQGKKFAHVPFEHKPFSGEKMAGNLGDDIKKIMVSNRGGGQQPITEIFRDLEGKPIVGKVATAGKHPTNPNLSNLTKYQSVSDSGRVSSVYMTFRTVSEDSAGWTHPGTSGYQLFKEAEQYVEGELKNILNTIL